MMFEAIAFNFKRKKRLSHMRQPLDFLEPLIGFEPTTLSLRTADSVYTVYVVCVEWFVVLYFVRSECLCHSLHRVSAVIAP